MKQAIFGMVAMLVVLFFSLICLTIHGRNLRQKEVENSLVEALDGAMTNLMKQEIYSIDSTDTFVADLLQTLLGQINSTSDIEVNILAADREKGILSVEITETYMHPNGKSGSVSALRTVILDKTAETEESLYNVEFYIDDQNLYKRYALKENSYCPVPVSPEKEGKRFRCWRFVTGGAGRADSAEIVYDMGKRQVLASGGMPYCAKENTRLIAVFE